MNKRIKEYSKPQTWKNNTLKNNKAGMWYTEIITKSSRKERNVHFNILREALRQKYEGNIQGKRKTRKKIIANNPHAIICVYLHTLLYSSIS